MYKGLKEYVCTIESVLKAAIVYDIICLQSKGLDSKTNFTYSRREIDAILQLPSFLGIKKRFIDLKISENLL